MARAVELRRHTDNDGDVLSDEGVAAALRLGAGLAGGYRLAVSTGAQRATQTVGCLLAALGQPVPDGVVHAFVLDTMVTGGVRRHGVGTRLVGVAVEEARAAGCEWLHADFEDHLRGFYFDACGFTPTNAGLIGL